ncbi:hypothetical protein Vretimale_10195 [Volvox reticuliferus]|uniref:Uncharacterized protein n=1 Tax=Volvox reticuliferus TaxID=1737510 RepID=A0A8J4C1S3_9CHLO|nr:hypothetical protein Vretifemale_522 [Volvox reticuliferus]GIM05802.1 hypothetical protein Vretimale_10195 [Volvox reticuliferus]
MRRPLCPPARPHREHGLEWLPASPAVQPLLDCSPTSTNTSISAHPRPLLVILPWMWASRAAVARHITLYHRLGCDVAIFYGWPALSVWLPLLAQRNAAKLLTALAAHLRDQPRDIVLTCFSGAAKGILCPLMERLVPGAAAVAAAAAAAAALQPGPAGALGGTVQPAKSNSAVAPVAATRTAGVPVASHTRYVLSLLSNMFAAALHRFGMISPQQTTQQQEQQRSPPPPLDPSAALLLRHLRGVIFDSGPVDFDSSVGVRLFTTSRHPTVRGLQATAGAAAAGTLDFCLYEVFEAQRRAMWASLRSSLAAAHLPALFLYSWSGDALADPQPIHALAVALRSGATTEAAAAAAGAMPEARNVCRNLGAEAALVVDANGAQEGGRSMSECSDRGCVRICSSSSNSRLLVADAVTKIDSSPDDARNDGSSDKYPLPHIDSGSARSSPLGVPRGAEGQCDGGAAGTEYHSCHRAATAVTTALRYSHHRTPGHGAEPLRVWEQGWDFSPHVAHLRDHPEQYRQVVAAFLDSCLGARPVIAGAAGGAGYAGGGGGGVGTPLGVIAKSGRAAVSRL